MCWHIDAELQTGTCVSLCGGSFDAPLCAEGTSCAITNEGVLNLCLPRCDPLLQDCEPGWMCIFDQDRGLCVIEPNYLADQGEPCEYVNGCKAGLACIDGAEVPMCEGLMCCSLYCDHTLPNACTGAPEVSCQPWFEPGQAPAGYEHLGRCSLL